MQFFSVRTILATAVLMCCLYSQNHAQTGIVDYVPNGSFELIAKPDAQLGMYAPRFGKYSLFWRQFHGYLLPIDPETLPEWPVTRDRVWLDDPLQMYEPVTCSSTDLFSAHIPDCIIGPPVPSHYDTRENWFGKEPIRPGSIGQKYAGLYYRLNGIVPNGVNSYGPAIPGDANAGWWREYLEVELLCELEANKEYTLSFWASLAEVSDVGIPIQARVTPLPYYTNPLDNCDIKNDADDNNNSCVRPPVTDGPPGQIVTSGIIPKNGVGPNGGWVKVEANFTAVGGEKYLTLGYWGNVPDVTPAVIEDCITFYHNAPKTPRRAYVYIDDVRLQTATSVSCNCNAQIKLIPVMPSPEEGKCCYKVMFTSSSMGEYGCVGNACTIESIVGTLEGSETPVFSWASNSEQPAIIGDGITRDLGTMCVNEFFSNIVRVYSFKIYSTNNQVICNEQFRTYGCKSTCNCYDFEKSISVSSVSSGGNPCCFKVSLDATILSGCAQIASIEAFKATSSTKVAIPSASYTQTVPTNFSGDLYSFCPPSPFSFAGGEFFHLEFKDASGEIICIYDGKPQCECNCKDVRAEVVYRAVTGPNNACCYDVVVKNTSDCRVEVGEVVINGSDIEWLTITGSNGFLAGHNTANGKIKAGKFSKMNAPVSLYKGQEIVVGRVCPDECLVRDLAQKTTQVAFRVNGAYCIPKYTASTSTPTLCAANGFDCSKFTVTIDPHPSGNGNCCWFGVNIKVDLCDAELQGLYVESAGFPTQPVPTNKQYNMIWSWQCQAKTVIVHLKRADGTILCTKTAVYPPQFSCAGGDPPASIVARSAGEVQETDILKNATINTEIQSLIISRDSETVDSVFTQLQTNWVVYNTEMQIVAQKTLTGANNMNVQDVLRTLPSAVYLLQGTDVLGNSISRRVYVQP